MSLGELEQLRSELPVRISWPVLLLKAFGTVTTRHARLRQTWRTFPWSHLYQHQASAGTICVSRRFREDDWLFWARFRNPSATPLVELQERLDGFAHRPVEKVFRQQLTLSGLPTLARRLIWWSLLNLSGEKRATRIGTFSISSVAGRGAEIQRPPGFVTSVLTLGPLNDEGRSRITISYDHRVMDGGFVAQFLKELEAELRGPIQTELESLSEQHRRAA